jgi:hypothetical protein
MAFGKFGRYHPDGVDVRVERFDLVALLRDELAALAAGPGAAHRLRFETGAEACQLETDREHVRYIVVNLLQNAVKYSRPGSEVRLALEVEGEQIRLRVSDEGIGVPEAEIAELFSPFYRASNVESRPGTGMGLAIVKKSAGLIGARVSVDSPRGEGTAFTVVLGRRLERG